MRKTVKIKWKTKQIKSVCIHSIGHAEQTRLAVNLFLYYLHREASNRDDDDAHTWSLQNGEIQHGMRREK